MSEDRIRARRTAEAIKLTRIINTYDQLYWAGGGVAITYRKQDLDRGGHRAAFQIVRVVKGASVKTDPLGVWYNYGHKTFVLHGTIGKTRAEVKASVLEDAKAWVLQQYGEAGPWARNAMGDYVPERVQRAFPIKKVKREKKL